MDEFNERLEKEWLAGRSMVIYKALHKRYQDIGRNRTSRRVDELVRKASHVDVSPLSLTATDELILRTATALAQAQAENALVAIALYLAESEPPSQS